MYASVLNVCPLPWCPVPKALRNLMQTKGRIVHKNIEIIHHEKIMIYEGSEFSVVL